MSDTGDLARAQERIRDLEAEVERARASGLQLEAEILAARRSSEAQADELERARASASHFEAEIEQARLANADLEGQLAHARRASEALEREIEAAREGASDLSSQLADARESSAKLGRQIAKAREGSSDLSAQVATARERVLRQEATLRHWSERCVALERAVRGEWRRWQRKEDPPADEIFARIDSELRRPPPAEIVAAWPLTEAVPPASLIYRTAGHRDRSHFARSRGPGLRAVLELAEEGGCDVRSLERVLDFGCGCGRLLAAWEPYCPPVEVYGVDLDGDLIDWCETHLPFVEARQNQLEPPLEFPAAHFDLIYAASVFTHLTPEAGRAWADELYRVLRPGGTLVASYQGSHYHEELRRSSNEAYERLRSEGYHLEQFVGVRSAPDGEGSNYFSAYHTEESFRELFSGWELRATALSAERGATDFAARQDVMVFRR
ncbi:MAG: methyltransferase domain-containing protein [Deltaproteobacteria bacterium]|jgi:SAM-dependent methyltransferase|nr:methyltransferase domain-containing protein [Deltaproteobacteria bacterium]MBW2496226.1 methyltransferase domain-containing protein [Deltaproteobacteria bacterium]